jgi:hypothetical protein
MELYFNFQITGEVRVYASASVRSPRHMRVAEKSVKGGLNL